MTLETYLRQPGVTAADLAKKTGLSAASISRIAKGLQKPSFAAMQAISRHTAGEVTANDLVGSA